MQDIRPCKRYCSTAFRINHELKAGGEPSIRKHGNRIIGASSFRQAISPLQVLPPNATNIKIILNWHNQFVFLIGQFDPFTNVNVFKMLGQCNCFKPCSFSSNLFFIVCNGHQLWTQRVSFPTLGNWSIQFNVHTISQPDGKIFAPASDIASRLPQ